MPHVAAAKSILNRFVDDARKITDVYSKRVSRFQAMRPGPPRRDQTHGVSVRWQPTSTPMCCRYAMHC